MAASVPVVSPYPNNCHKLHVSRSYNHDFHLHISVLGIANEKYHLYSFQIGEGDKLINVVLLNGERLNVRVQVTWLEMFRSLTFDTFDIPLTS